MIVVTIIQVGLMLKVKGVATKSGRPSPIDLESVKTPRYHTIF